MENERLLEIRNALAGLPVLQERMEKLRRRIYEAEDDVRLLLHKFEAESLDVDQLKKDSLSVTILKLIGKYEGKLNKETQEMLAAKMEYDKASDRVKGLHLERRELSSRISELNNDKKIYEAELNRREEAIVNSITSEVSIKYRQLEEERVILAKQLIETDEAIRAANRVKSTAESAMGHLNGAESWATYDVWTRGGLFSHLAKYDHIDNAQYDFNRLYCQISDLQKELSDVNFLDAVELTGIDSTTRTIDFWFDNIFTDLNVRSRIREDKEEVRSLLGQMSSIISRLERNKREINRQLTEIDNRKNDLIISG